MGDDKISDNEAIDAALHLDGDPGKVREFYEDWARSYNDDTSQSEYSGPVIATRLLREHLDPGGGSLLDAGCGTGLVGVELRKLGYDRVDGFDLSPAMADEAIATGAYRDVRGGIDLMRAPHDYPGADYEAVLSIGVFTLGHVPPQGLGVLLELVRPGGLLLVSTRVQYYEQSGFQQVTDDLLADGEAALVRLVRDAPYNNDGDAHYWVFRRSGRPGRAR